MTLPCSMLFRAHAYGSGAYTRVPVHKRNGIALPGNTQHVLYTIFNKCNPLHLSHITGRLIVCKAQCNNKRTAVQGYIM